RQYVNNAGTPGTMSFDDEVEVTEGFVFAQAEMDLPADFYLTAGASLNNLRYSIARVSEAATNLNFRQGRKIKAQVSPRLGLVKMLTENLSAHASVSTGFSPPTEAEIRP